MYTTLGIHELSLVKEIVLIPTNDSEYIVRMVAAGMTPMMLNQI